MVKKGNRKNGKRTGPKKIQYTTGRPTQNVRSSVGFASSQSDIKHVHAITNPFSDEARGSKIPDDDSSKSIPMTLWDIHTFSATGTNFACGIQPALRNNIYTALTIVSSTVTAWNPGQDITDYSALSSAIHQFRIVSWGVRVFSTLAPTDQSGYFRIITLPESNFGSALNYGSTFFEEVKAYPLSDTTVHWISKPIGTAWKEYKDVSATMDWDRVLVVANGLPSGASGAITVEVVYNIEVQPNIGSITGSLATPALEHKPHVLTAAANTLAKHAGSHIQRNFGEVIKTFGRRALEAAVSYFMPAYKPAMRMIKG
jgi:hypothetical protein